MKSNHLIDRSHLKRIIEGYIRLIDLLNETVGQLASWLTTLLVLLVCLDVIRRYVFNATTVAIIELEWHLFALTFLLCAGFTLKHDRHVRVDVFYNRFSEKTKAWVNLLGALIFLLPFCWVVVQTSYSFAAYAYQLNEGSPNPGGLPARYLIKGAITLGFILLFLQATALVFSSVLVILGLKPYVFPSEVQKGGEEHA